MASPWKKNSPKCTPVCQSGCESLLVHAQFSEWLYNHQWYVSVHSIMYFKAIMEKLGVRWRLWRWQTLGDFLHPRKSRKTMFEIKSLELWSLAALAFPCWAQTRAWCHCTQRICTYKWYSIIHQWKLSSVSINPLIYTVGKAVTVNSPNGLLASTKGVRVQEEIGLNLLLGSLASSHKLNWNITVKVHSTAIWNLGLRSCCIALILTSNYVQHQ